MLWIQYLSSGRQGTHAPVVEKKKKQDVFGSEARLSRLSKSVGASLERRYGASPYYFTAWRKKQKLLDPLRTPLMLKPKFCTFASSTQRLSTRIADAELPSNDPRSGDRFPDGSNPIPFEKRATTSEKKDGSARNRSEGLKRPKEIFLPRTKRWRVPYRRTGGSAGARCVKGTIHLKVCGH